MNAALEARLNELETKFSFQEQHISDLNDVIAAQSQALSDLERKLELLARRSDNATGAAGLAGDEPPPPHY